MRTIIRITKSELRILFFSPIAWLILIVFSFQVGMAYSDALEMQLRNQELGYRMYAVTSSLFDGYSGILSGLLGNLYLYIPLFTMGLMSRELSSGSIKLLYSSPVSNFQIILGKYLAVVVYALLLCIILLGPVVSTCFSVQAPDVPMMLTGIFGVFLTVLAYGAIGLFMSTITKYQVVAVVGTLAILAILNFIGGVGQEYDFVRDITYWLSISGRAKVFISGMISTKDTLYFILVIFMFLGLSVIKLQGERLKLSKWNTSSKYGVVLLIALSLGYISSLPGFIAYYDSTATKVNTLTEESQEIVRKLKGDLTITTYVNYLDETYDRGAPRNRIDDIAQFEQYLRFKPETKLKYVYYYAKGYMPYAKAAYDTMTLEQVVEDKCRYSGYNPKRFLPLDEVLKMDDISGEDGRFARVITAANGKKAMLRIYKDNQVHPFEAQISTALKTLLQEAPVVGFVTGHKERSGVDMGEKGYGSFASNKTFRYSLINSGYGIREISLDQPVADDIDIVVLADMRSDFTEEEFRNFDSYLARGGNLFILGEPKRQQFMNPVIERLGLRFADGIIVSPSEVNLDDIIAANIKEGAAKVSENYIRYFRRGYSIITPSACAVEVIDTTKGFKITEVLASASSGSWIEKETTDFINEKSVLNPAVGEVEKSNSIMLYLTRPVKNKEQRIFVIGDADCISTLELSQNRAGFRSSNFTLITETFRNMSYEEFPVDAARVNPPDDRVVVTQGTVVIKVIIMWIIPILLMIGCITLLIRRKRK
ncbi:Gldg family protein [Odoribacter sp. AF15-53]|uniref:Gldg family protein n=1 Tax=Odoribacter sp. AF15-53 TaxID=2292236 RepID=UPI000E493D63|nr:Gldg family protein [Odoribacter sp. AF15-53]RHR78319.1 ABC transporter [Odoribacter sp. AF15-53]